MRVPDDEWGDIAVVKVEDLAPQLRRLRRVLEEARLSLYTLRLITAELEPLEWLVERAAGQRAGFPADRSSR